MVVEEKRMICRGHRVEKVASLRVDLLQVQVVFPLRVVLIGKWVISPLFAVKYTHGINLMHVIIIL
jgi:hypothetical protein